MGKASFAGILARTVLVSAFAGASTSSFAEGDLANGRYLAGAQCARCHGQDGNARSTSLRVVPMLAGQPAAYLVQEMRNYADGTRAVPDNGQLMKTQLEQLSEQDFEDIAVFYEAQKRY